MKFLPRKIEDIIKAKKKSVKMEKKIERIKKKKKNQRMFRKNYDNELIGMFAYCQAQFQLAVQCQLN